jgi:hypothetical protein
MNGNGDTNLISITPKSYLEERVKDKLASYSNASRRNRISYYVLSVISIIFAASVPVLIGVGAPSAVTTVLSLAVTITISLEKLFQFRGLWRNYDEARAALVREEYLFRGGVGDYNGKSGDEAFALFVERFEEIIRAERSETIEARTRTPSGAQT